jgi:putative tricarboxylic transport membrane protein
MKNVGVWVGGIILAFAATLFIIATSYEYYSKVGPGPGLFPLWLCGALIILSILYIIESMSKNRITFADVMPKGVGLGNVLAVLVSLILFLILVHFLGFSIPCVIMLIILFKRDYRWGWTVGLSLVVTVALVVIFQTFLDVPLPMNDWGF